MQYSYESQINIWRGYKIIFIVISSFDRMKLRFKAQYFIRFCFSCLFIWLE